MHGAKANLPMLVPNVTSVPGNSCQLMLEFGDTVTIDNALRQSIVNTDHAKNGTVENIAVVGAFVNVAVQKLVVSRGGGALIPRFRS